eukprot:jgi/Bigna1/74518/fgenesh1_pg.29_\
MAKMVLVIATHDLILSINNYNISRRTRIQIRINGQVAGIASPFPVIYTGGVNPLLWRPLTGIMSFDIPPYRFDISPFLGVVNTRKPVNISAEVISNSGGNSTGVWLIGGGCGAR